MENNLQKVRLSIELNHSNTKQKSINSEHNGFCKLGNEHLHWACFSSTGHTIYGLEYSIHGPRPFTHGLGHGNLIHGIEHGLGQFI